ncbi:TPA: multidrug ABC transporter permease [Candidatus Latescibacteria bacterium]|nr:multidrug ABC transporter permease [Candidatus Latescibacterota bacterium]
MPDRPILLLAIYSLWKREILRFVRDRNRLLGSILQPLLLWVLVGSGFRGSFSTGIGDGPTYLEYIYPGTMMLILLFTAIFSTISVVEDRREGFMQSVVVAPIRSFAIVMGKILGGTTVAVGEGLVFLILAPLVDIPITPVSFLATLGTLILIAISMTGLGFKIAWRMESTAGFHAIMNLLLLPMWLLSGAFFPLSGAPEWLAWVMRINPMTYATAALRRVLYYPDATVTDSLPDLPVCLAITALFGVVMIVWSAIAVGDRERGTE